jgi:hypothetical protein
MAGGPLHRPEHVLAIATRALQGLLELRLLQNRRVQQCLSHGAIPLPTQGIVRTTLYNPISVGHYNYVEPTLIHKH